MNNNNKLKNYKYKESFLKCASGGVVIYFAVMLPAILTCMLFSVNYVRIMGDRSLISEATNEASLAIVSIDNKNDSVKAKEQNRKLALRYINYFITHKERNSDRILNENAHINIDYNPKKEEYYVDYNQPFETLTGVRASGESDTFVVSSKIESYGNTRKNGISDATFDVAFISDFSGSITCDYNDVNCDKTGQIGDDSRLKYMKEAIENILHDLQGYSNFHFALIPYDLGVPVEIDTKNPAGGDNYGCSFMYKMLSPYDSIDWNFWANKEISYLKWKKLIGSNGDYIGFNYFPKYRDKIQNDMEAGYYNYYAQLIGPTLGIYDDNGLVTSGLCRKRDGGGGDGDGGDGDGSQSDGEEYPQYVCGESDPTYPSDQNKPESFERDYGYILQLTNWSRYVGSDHIGPTIANVKAVDVDGTIRTLFNGMDRNTITFNRFIVPQAFTDTLYTGMCQSVLFNNSIKTYKGSTSKEALKSEIKRITDGRYIRDFKPLPHLIPFSYDENHNANLLNAIAKEEWLPGGGTDTMSALLRTVPVMAKGQSDNKIMIILSDGKDNNGGDILRDQFLQKNVCDAITLGLKSKKNESDGYITKAANSAVIYYIKLSPKVKGITTDEEYDREFGYWYSKCVHKEKAFLKEAQDKQTLYDTMKEIFRVESGIFINKQSSDK